MQKKQLVAWLNSVTQRTSPSESCMSMSSLSCEAGVMMRLSNRSGGGDAAYSIDFAVGAFLQHT